MQVIYFLLSAKHSFADCTQVFWHQSSLWHQSTSATLHSRAFGIRQIRQLFVLGVWYWWNMYSIPWWALLTHSSCGAYLAQLNDFLRTATCGPVFAHQTLHTMSDLPIAMNDFHSRIQDSFRMVRQLAPQQKPHEHSCIHAPVMFLRWQGDLLVFR